MLCAVFVCPFQVLCLSKNSYCPPDFCLALCGSVCACVCTKCHSEWVTLRTCCLTHSCPFSLLSPTIPSICSLFFSVLLLLILALSSPLSTYKSSLHHQRLLPLASLSSLLITPFPSPGSSLTSSCASSYQRRWLRSQTTSLENGVFPRWWDSVIQSYMHTHLCKVQCTHAFYTSECASNKETCTYAAGNDGESFKCTLGVVKVMLISGRQVFKDHGFSKRTLSRVYPNRSTPSIFLSCSGLCQAFVKFILRGLPQNRQKQAAGKMTHTAAMH